MCRPCPFKVRDLKRAARAVIAMGLGIGSIEIGRDGSIVVVLKEVTTADSLRREAVLPEQNLKDLV